MESQSSTEIGLDRLLSHTHDGVFVLDRQGRYLMFNRACEELTGYQSSEVLGGPCGDVGVKGCHDEHGRPLEPPLCPGRAVLKGELPSARQRMRITTRSGQHRWVETSYACILDDRGEPECVIGVMRDVSEAKEREDRRAADVSAASHGGIDVREDEPDAGVTRLDDVLADVERRTILSGLRQARGQRSRAAKLLGISRSRLYRRMDALGIVPREQQF